MYLVGFFDRILKYCLSSDISSKKVFQSTKENLTGMSNAVAGFEAILDQKWVTELNCSIWDI